MGDKSVIISGMIKRLEAKYIDESRYNGVTLWTMTKNKRSSRFYEKIGFRRTGGQRISQRNGESFTEVKYYRA